MDLFWLFVLIVVVVHFYLEGYSWTKQEIADSYGVCRKTLNKWVFNFCSSVNYNVWLKKRKLDFIEVLTITFFLGEPDNQQVFSKKDILHFWETKYSTIRDSVMKNAAKLNITEAIYKSMDVFPPKVSSRILGVL